jgi:hypothetical protein
MKKISCVIFFVKKTRKKCFLWCFFRENSFRDIIRKKRKFINDESYVSSSECYKNMVKSFSVIFEESVSEAGVSNNS